MCRQIVQVRLNQEINVENSATATSGTTTADDAYVTAAKALIDAGTCDAVSPNSICGTDATSYYKEFEYNGMRVILSSGVPDHDAESDQLVSNPNERCERWQYMEVPIDPAKVGYLIIQSINWVHMSIREAMG